MIFTIFGNNFSLSLFFLSYILVVSPFTAKKKPRAGLFYIMRRQAAFGVKR